MKVPYLQRIREPAQNVMGGLLNMVIPQEMKDQGISIFLKLSENYTAKEFEFCIQKNVSIWTDLLDDKTKSFMKQAPNDAFARGISSVISSDLIAQWVVESRPDLTDVFIYRESRDWLARQIDEIRRELGLA